jgi:CPA1 family monovalent cation:H+ antiporter
VPVLLVIVVSLVIAGVARRLGWSAPLLLVLGGLVCALLPFFPNVVLEPELALYGILPPLLYSAALASSYVDIRSNLRPILLLSVGLVLFTTVAVGAVVNLMVPALGLPLALALGAVVAPSDAVATTAMGRTLGLPRRMLTILSGESLFNDATALTVYSVAVAAAVGAATSLGSSLATFAVAAFGGLLVGLAGGLLAHAVLRRLRDPALETATNLLVPFLLFAAAEQVHASGVLAVVVAGLLIGQRSPRTLGYATRLQSESVWRVVDLVLESLVFFVIGLQLTTAVRGLQGDEHLQLAAWSVVVLVVVIAARFLWVVPSTYLSWRLPRVAGSPTPVAFRSAIVVSWAGMRGVVSLAAAFALPFTTQAGAPLPGRDLVVFLTFVVVVGTLLIQGLTLPKLARRLGVAGPPVAADRLAEAAATHRAVQAGVDRLDALLEQDDDVPVEVVQQLRDRAGARSNGAWERLSAHEVETPTDAYRRLRLEMLAAEREVLVTLRDNRELDDELLRRAQRELDIEEAALNRE